MDLDYIEFWATTHCNLHCRGCSSCSPIAETCFLSESQLAFDLQRLKSLGINIRNINILGGEPLLHPNICDLFRCVKNIYPDCGLGILTNGFLLPQMDHFFWECCKQLNVKINVTCFPVMSAEIRDAIIQKISSFKLAYHVTEKKRFNKILTLNNNSSIAEIQKQCGCKNAYNLNNGYVSRCTVPMVVGNLNRKFGCDFIETGKLNIHTSTGEEILKFLETPNDSCRNCSAHPIKVSWATTACPQLSDWVIGENEHEI